MRRNSLYILLVLLFVTKALLFCLVLRPWLGPDEAIRFEYARLFASTGLKTLTPETSESNQQEILRSLSLFKAWDFMDLPQPSESGQRSFLDSPFQKDSASTTYPPLYYLLLGNFWKALGIRDLLPQLYSGRLISLALSGLQLLLLASLARCAWPHADIEVKMAAALVFMAFLPQWGYLSSSIHSDNWSNLLAAVILLEFALMINGPRNENDGEFASRRRIHFYALRAAMIIALLVLMALSTRATTIVLVILLLGAAPLFVHRLRRSYQRHKKALLLAALVLVILAAFVWILIEKTTHVPEELQEAVGRGLMQRGAAIPTQQLGTIVTRIGEVTPGNLIRSLVVVFTTFWLALGTLVYKLSAGWLFVLGLVTATCAYGWLRRFAVLTAIRNNPIWLLFWVAPITTLAAVLYLYGPHQSLAPEGRYLLLVLPTIAILFTEGWLRSFKSETLRIAFPAWICGWIFLDGIVLFEYVIPLYYL
jgi:hypothetical protein